MFKKTAMDKTNEYEVTRSLIKQEVQLRANRRIPIMEYLCHALMTIKTTSAKTKKFLNIKEKIVIKIRNRLTDERIFFSFKTRPCL